MKNLVIVESPSKSKTIEKYLGKDYKVLSSKGHIRDLATTGKFGLGVDLEDHFKPNYILMKGKSKLVNELNNSLTSVTRIGNLQNSTTKTVSIGNKTNTNVDTIALAPKSRYLVFGRVSFPLNTSGSRAVRILYNGSYYNTVEVGPNPSSSTALLTEAIIDNTSDSTLNVAVVAFQSSGNTLSVSGNVEAVLLKALWLFQFIL